MSSPGPVNVVAVVVVVVAVAVSEIVFVVSCSALLLLLNAQACPLGWLKTLPVFSFTYNELQLLLHTTP